MGPASNYHLDFYLQNSSNHYPFTFIKIISRLKRSLDEISLFPALVGRLNTQAERCQLGLKMIWIKIGLLRNE